MKSKSLSKGLRKYLRHKVVPAISYNFFKACERSIKSARIESLALCYTGRCNSRCIFCYQWKNRCSPEMEIKFSEIEELFASDSLKNLRSLTISGGEPFVRDDFDKVALLTKDFFPKITIRTETNCLLPKTIYKKVKNVVENEIPISVKVSLDGPKEVHDWCRGINGNFDKVIETIDLLRSIRSEKLTITMSAFYFPENVEYIPWLVDFSKRYNIPSALHRIQIAPMLFNESHKDIKKSEILYSEELVKYLNQAYEKGLINIFSAFYEETMINKEKTNYICTQDGSSLIYVNHIGEVYPCSVRIPELCFGSIRKQSLDDLLKSKRVKLVKKNIKDRTGICKDCTNECHLPSSIANHPYNLLKVTKWYLRKKMRNRSIIEKY